MKYVIVALILAFSVSDAGAAVYCAAGAYHVVASVDRPWAEPLWRQFIALLSLRQGAVL